MLGCQKAGNPTYGATVLNPTYRRQRVLGCRKAGNQTYTASINASEKVNDH